MTKLLFWLCLLAAVLFGGMYASESWIFAFAPSAVDELTLVYRETREQVQLSPAQTRLVLGELREAKSYATLDDIPSLPDKYQVSHELLTREGEKVRRYFVFLEHDLVTDGSYQNLRQLGEATRQLIALVKPVLPGQLDVVVPERIATAAGEPISSTRYLLPVAYGAADFRVYDSGGWNVDWGKQALVLAAWGEQPGAGYELQISELALVEQWLRVTVRYACPKFTSENSQPSYPLAAVLIDRERLQGLAGVCFVDSTGNIFASQALGLYPIERYFTTFLADELPLTLPATGKGIHTALQGDQRVQTLVVFLDTTASSQPVIERIVEVSPGNFQLRVSYQPGEARYHAVLIAGYGSSWKFQLR